MGNRIRLRLKQLPVLVSVVASDETVYRSTLSWHAEGFACEIVGRPSEGLVKEIFEFFEHYASKTVPSPTTILRVCGHTLNSGMLTPFTEKSLRCVADISFGETRRYGEIAKMLLSPRAARAVGSACARNPLPFFIPCHRVLSTHGIGGFSQGLPIKQVLLNFEQR